VIDYARNARTNQIERRGIINDRVAFPVITAEALIGRGESGGGNIATGYHALEFLLWGQDSNTSGPGERPYTDFIGGSASPDPDSDRRRQYLIVVADLLIEDLEATRAAWNDGEPYLSKFLANVGNQSLKSMITGISRLSGDELADKRIQAAYDSRDQEDEPSSFSDNTHNDLKYNLAGVENVYFGRFNQDDSLGLEDLVKSKNPALDLRIKSALAEAATAVAAVPVPFDQAIQGDAASLRKVRTAMEALDALNAELTQVNATLGI
jgi:putative iron-regulated protein